MYLVLNIHTEFLTHREGQVFSCQHLANILYLPQSLSIHSLLFVLQILSKIEQKWEVARTEREKGEGLFVFTLKNYSKISKEQDQILSHAPGPSQDPRDVIFTE